mmetsp:Transcript_6470/g.14702  ORF Transcript_6470/g.14702 Transcript_6470/m.14702 type:complete len:356 (-) Transcript_6470:1911-2978(-)
MHVLLLTTTTKTTAFPPTMESLLLQMIHSCPKVVSMPRRRRRRRRRVTTTTTTDEQRDLDDYSDLVHMTSTTPFSMLCSQSSAGVIPLTVLRAMLDADPHLAVQACRDGDQNTAASTSNETTRTSHQDGGVMEGGDASTATTQCCCSGTCRRILCVLAREEAWDALDWIVYTAYRQLRHEVEEHDQSTCQSQQDEKEANLFHAACFLIGQGDVVLPPSYWQHLIHNKQNDMWLTRDASGNIPLHYALQHPPQDHSSILAAILKANPKAAQIPNPQGQVALHLVLSKTTSSSITTTTTTITTSSLLPLLQALVKAFPQALELRDPILDLYPFQMSNNVSDCFQLLQWAPHVLQQQS